MQELAHDDASQEPVITNWQPFLDAIACKCRLSSVRKRQHAKSLLFESGLSEQAFRTIYLRYAIGRPPYDYNDPSTWALPEISELVELIDPGSSSSTIGKRIEAGLKKIKRHHSGPNRRS